MFAQSSVNGASTERRSTLMWDITWTCANARVTITFSRIRYCEVRRLNRVRSHRRIESSIGMKKSKRLLCGIGLTALALVAFLSLPPLVQNPSAKFVDKHLIGERSFNDQTLLTDERVDANALKILLKKSATRGGWIPTQLVRSKEMFRALVKGGSPGALWPERIRARSLRGVGQILSLAKQHSDFAQRFGGIDALQKKSVPWILKRLKDDDLMIRINALEILGAIPEFADVIIPKIRATVDSAPPLHQYTYPVRTFHINGKTKPYGAREKRPLDGRARFHVSAGEALLQLDSSMRDEVASLWNEVFQDTKVDTDTRIAALSNLSEINDSEAREQTEIAVALAKRKLVSSPDYFSHDALQVFRWYGEALKETLPELLDYLDKKKHLERAPLNAISLPGYIAPESIDSLQALYEFRAHEDADARFNAIYGLNRIRGFEQELVDVFQDFFDDTDGAVRSMAALYAWKRDPSLEETVLSILSDGLDSSESSVWRNTLFALKEMGDSSAPFVTRLWKEAETTNDPLRALSTLNALFEIDESRRSEIRLRIESYSESENQAVQRRADWILSELEDASESSLKLTIALTLEGVQRPSREKMP